MCPWSLNFHVLLIGIRKGMENSNHRVFALWKTNTQKLGCKAVALELEFRPWTDTGPSLPVRVPDWCEDGSGEWASHKPHDLQLGTCCCLSWMSCLCKTTNEINKGWSLRRIQSSHIGKLTWLQAHTWSPTAYSSLLKSCLLAGWIENEQLIIYSSVHSFSQCYLRRSTILPKATYSFPHLLFLYDK